MLGGKRKKKAWLCIMQNMCTDHTQTLSPREPHGISFHYAKHAHRAHPDPKPKGAQMGLQNMCTHHTQTPSPMEPHGISFHYAKHVHTPHPDPEPKGAFSYTNNTPRPHPDPSPMDPNHTQTPNPREPDGVAKHVRTPHPDPKPNGAPWNFISLCKTCAQTTPRP